MGTVNLLSDPLTDRSGLVKDFSLEIVAVNKVAFLNVL